MNIPVKSLLSVALLTALVGSGVVLTQAQAQTQPSTVDPQSLVHSPGQPVGSPAAVVIPPSPGVPPAVPATTPPITGPTPAAPAAIVVPSQPLPPDPEVDRLRAESQAQAMRIAELTAAGADESILLREVSRYRAKLQLLNVASQVDKAQQTMASDRLKFELEQAKAKAELSSTQTPALVAPGAVGGPGVPGLVGQPSVQPVEAKPDFSLVGVSSFAGKRMAEVVSPEFGSVSVEVGSTLPNGARVTSITDSSVVVSHRGKRQTVHLSAGAPPAGKQAAQAVNKN